MFSFAKIRNRSADKGITILEVIIIIAIIAILAAIVYESYNKFKERSYYARAMQEFKTMYTALLLYYNDNKSYPPDVSRDIPSGLGPYLQGYEGGLWPTAPWPGSVYDWENWDDPDNPGKKIYQISIRFCPMGGPLSACQFPDAPWAEDFGINSAIYFCVYGHCRSHTSENYDYPGFCVNCAVQPSGS